jgi:hypothetical protein
MTLFQLHTYCTGTLARRLLGLGAATLTAGVAQAATVTYDYVDVSYIFGGGSTETRTGAETFIPISSNLPIAKTGGSAEYRIRDLADPGSLTSGSWSWSNGTDSLYGSYQTFSEVFSYQGSPFARYTGTRTVEGGSGYFTGATGSGTYEFYAVYQGTSSPTDFVYQGVDVARMSVTLVTEVPIAQSDTRGAYVIVKNGIENLEAGTGTNSGPFTSASPGLIPWQTETSNYTFTPLPVSGPPFVATFVDTNANGSVTGTAYSDQLILGHLGTIFNYSSGTAQTTGGTGLYAGATGGSDYETMNYVVGSTSTDWRYSQVVVARINPIPEPETYAMLLAGLGFVGVAIRRRRRA